MALSTGRSKLHDAHKTLRAHWEAVEGVWKDSVRRDFEDNYWKPLEPEIHATLRGIDRLAQVLQQVHNDCS